LSRPKLLLFDTGCIFEVVRLGLWEHLRNQYRVVVPSTVVHIEACFVVMPDRSRKPLDLQKEVAAGLIEEYTADPTGLAATLSCWPDSIRNRADPGEVEALTYLRTLGTEGVAFLTADGPAIQAAVAMECGDAATSLDWLLNTSGCKRNGLDRKFTDQFITEHRQRGTELLLQSLSPSATGGRGSRRGRR